MTARPALALGSTPSITDTYLGPTSLSAPTNPLTRTLTMPRKVESQDFNFAGHLQAVPQAHFDRPRTAHEQLGPAQTPFTHTELWRSASVHPLSQSRPYQAPEQVRPDSAQAVQGFLQPAKPWTAPPQLSALPSNITPYLPPKRSLPFGQRPQTAESGVRETNIDNAVRPQTSANTTDASMSYYAGLRDLASKGPNDGHRVYAARPSSGVDSDYILLPTSSTISSPTRSSPVKSAVPSRPMTSSSIKDNNLSALAQQHGTEPMIASLNGIGSTFMPGQFPRSSSPVLSTMGKEPSVIPNTPQAQSPRAPAPAVVERIETSKVNNAAETKKRPAQSADSTGNNPPKKRAPARKRAPKSSTPTTQDATAAPDLDTLLMNAFKDFDVDASLQDYTSQRPGSGRQNFVNDLICRHLESDYFLDFCENVENAWCRIGLDHRK